MLMMSDHTIYCFLPIIFYCFLFFAMGCDLAFHTTHVWDFNCIRQNWYFLIQMFWMCLLSFFFLHRKIWEVTNLWKMCFKNKTFDIRRNCYLLYPDFEMCLLSFFLSQKSSRGYNFVEKPLILILMVWLLGPCDPYGPLSSWFLWSLWSLKSLSICFLQSL